MPPTHSRIILAFNQPVAKIAPTIDDLLGGTAADSQLQSAAGDQIRSPSVLRHVMRILIPHVDHCGANFNPPGLLRLEPYSEGLRDRIWWGSASNATAAWAAKLGMNLQTSTLKFDESGEPLHIQQAAQIRSFQAAWKEAGHARTPRVSVSRSIIAMIDDRDRAYFGRGSHEEDSIGFLDETTRAIFGRSYAAEPDVLIEQIR